MAEHGLEKIAIPQVDDARIAWLESFARRRPPRDGEALVTAGERGFKFFVVLCGQVVIVEPSSVQRRTALLRGGYLRLTR